MIIRYSRTQLIGTFQLILPPGTLTVSKPNHETGVLPRTPHRSMVERAEVPLFSIFAQIEGQEPHHTQTYATHACMHARSQTEGMGKSLLPPTPHPQTPTTRAWKVRQGKVSYTDASPAILHALRIRVAAIEKQTELQGNSCLAFVF